MFAIISGLGSRVPEIYLDIAASVAPTRSASSFCVMLLRLNSEIILSPISFLILFTPFLCGCAVRNFIIASLSNLSSYVSVLDLSGNFWTVFCTFVSSASAMATLWMPNRYQFTISERSIQNLEAAMADSDNLTQFMQATAYVRFKPDTEERSTYLYRAYTKWCEDNLESPVPQKKFSQFLLKNAGKYGLTFSKHIEGKFAFASAAQQ